MKRVIKYALPLSGLAYLMAIFFMVNGSFAALIPNIGSNIEVTTTSTICLVNNDCQLSTLTTTETTSTTLTVPTTETSFQTLSTTTTGSTTTTKTTTETTTTPRATTTVTTVR